MTKDCPFCLQANTWNESHCIHCGVDLRASIDNAIKTTDELVLKDLHKRTVVMKIPRKLKPRVRWVPEIQMWLTTLPHYTGRDSTRLNSRLMGFIYDINRLNSAGRR